MELYGPAHYCNGPILIKLRSPDRAANMFFTLKDKFPSYISSLSSQIIRMDGGEYVSLAGEFNGMKEVTQEQWAIMEAKIRNTKGS